MDELAAKEAQDPADLDKLTMVCRNVGGPLGSEPRLPDRDSAATMDGLKWSLIRRMRRGEEEAMARRIAVDLSYFRAVWSDFAGQFVAS